MGSARRWLSAGLLLLAAAGAQGCASDLGPADHGPQQPPVDLYVVHRGTTDEPPRLSAYRVDGASGALTAIPGPGPALPLEDRAHEIVVDPTDRFVYVATRHDGPRAGGASGVRGLVYGFARDAASGALSPLAGSPFGDDQGGDFRSPATDASGRFLYVGDPLAEAIDAFTVDGAGALHPLAGRNTFPAANNVDGIAAAPSGPALYATSSDGSVLAYAVDAAGALRGAQAPLPAGRSTAIPVVHPGGRFLYAPNAESNDISGYAIDAASGRLSALPGSPFASGVGPAALALAKDGRALYVLNGLESTVSVFAVDAATGALRPLGAALPAGGPTQAAGSIVAEPGGRFVYAAGFGAATLSVYAVDPATGALTPAAPVHTAPRPAALALTHRPQ